MATSVIKLKAKPGQEAALEDVLTRVVAASNENETGIRFYQAFRSETPGEYWMLESFQDVAALKVHTSSEHFKAIRPELVACLDGAPEVQRLSNL
jgi:quinol monooxygenase YgiN